MTTDQKNAKKTNPKRTQNEQKTNQNETKRAKTSTAVGYVRRSTDRQEQSIDDQKNILAKYAQDNGIRLNKFYVDDAISGTYTLKRKAFLQMIEDAERPSRKFDSIVVYDIKRFGRVDNDEAGYYRHRLKMQGVEVIYVTENVTVHRV